MITIIDGAKGSGKTKRIINAASDALAVSKGDIVFLATTTRYRTEIKPQIKFVDTVEQGIKSKDVLFGFIKGMLSANYDIEYIFIDGVYKMMGVSIDSPEMAELFMMLERISALSAVKFILTVSCSVEEMPEFIAKYKN
ncbi:MAG: hypothetical protein J6A99_03015 [Clostridia bacterium]|nr:hypothetical protein [Clostridia bacterium]